MLTDAKLYSSLARLALALVTAAAAFDWARAPPPVASCNALKPSVGVPSPDGGATEPISAAAAAASPPSVTIAQAFGLISSLSSNAGVAEVEDEPLPIAPPTKLTRLWFSGRFK